MNKTAYKLLSFALSLPEAAGYRGTCARRFTGTWPGDEGM